MKYYRLNNQITTPKVRLIDEAGKFLGIIETTEALRMAQEKGLDLVEINPKEEPPIAKIMDFGQFRYQEAKKERKQKSKKVEVKGVRLSLRISKHDLEIKANQAKKFLSQGNKIKIEMNLRGRERMHLDLAEKMINDLISLIGPETKIEQPLNKQGGGLTILISR
ncbi:MAG: translation initiation factor IF-3 [Patescibacteria group bacterium]